MGKQRTKAYELEALENLGVTLAKASPPIGENEFPPIKANSDGLEKAIRMLPKKDRENVEKFWGLTGGTNHSKKVGLFTSKDIAYQEMFNKAIKSMRKLYSISFLDMYDDNLKFFIYRLSRKVKNNAIYDISNLEVIKYIVMFFIFIWNGPRMSYEDDSMSIDSEDYGDSTCDEYAMLKDACLILDNYPEGSFNLQLLISFIEMLDYQDMLVLKKSMGFDISEDCSKLDGVLDGVTLSPNEIECVNTFDKIRSFKEKIFGYGAWEVTNNLIVGNTVELQAFMNELNKVHRNWSKIEEYKAGQKRIRTSSEIRTLDVYNIGGLEFTDPNEICFLYLTLDFIES